MKKIGLLNYPLSAVIAQMGHGDTLAIADAGLPVPPTTERIDLAVSEGVPAFLAVLEATLKELQVEKAILAEEIKARSSLMHEKIVALLGNTPVEYVSHEAFKAMTEESVAVVRTGEFTPYCNVLLVSGVVF